LKTVVTRKHAEALATLDNYLAIVLSIHTFVESLLDQMIEAHSPAPPVYRQLRDAREFGFAVKLAIALQMRVIDEPLYKNLKRLNELRNRYAHEIDVDLASELSKSSFTTDGISPVFPDLKTTCAAIADEPQRGIHALLKIRDATFGWLLQVCTAKGVHIK